MTVIITFLCYNTDQVPSHITAEEKNQVEILNVCIDYEIKEVDHLSILPKNPQTVLFLSS